MGLDPQDFSEGVRRSEGALRAYLRNKTGAPREEVEELLQAILTRAWEKRADFRGGDLASWLYHFAAFAALAWHRARGRRLRAGEALSTHTRVLELATFDGELLQARRQELVRLRGCLDKLPEVDRRIVDWYYGRGAPGEPSSPCLGDREIAQRLSDTSPEEWRTDRVSKRRARALVGLARCMDAQPAEESMPDGRHRTPLYDLAEGLATGALGEAELVQRLVDDPSARRDWRRLTHLELLLMSPEPEAPALRLVRPPLPARGWVVALAAAAAVLLGLGIWRLSPERGEPRVLLRGPVEALPVDDDAPAVRYQAPSGSEPTPLCPEPLAEGRWRIGLPMAGVVQIGVPAPPGLALSDPWSVDWQLSRRDGDGALHTLAIEPVRLSGLGTDRWLYPGDLKLGALPALGFEVGDTAILTMDRGPNTLELWVVLMPPEGAEEGGWPACSDSP